MIGLTRFNGDMFFLNVTHIESVEATPDTLITLTNGKKFLVKDSVEDVVAKVNEFYRDASMPAVKPRGSRESDD